MKHNDTRPRFLVSRLGDGTGLLIEDSVTDTAAETDAPAHFVFAIVREAFAHDPGDAWRACDVAGFAERRARRYVNPAQVIDTGKTYRPVIQPDLFAA